MCIAANAKALIVSFCIALYQCVGQGGDTEQLNRQRQNEA
jgi:hypothetical protein